MRSPAEYAAQIDAARDRLIAFKAGCSAAALQSGGGRVERFAQIAVRHPEITAPDSKPRSVAEPPAQWLNRHPETQQSLPRNMRTELQSAMKRHSSQWSLSGEWS